VWHQDIHASTFNILIFEAGFILPPVSDMNWFSFSLPMWFAIEYCVQLNVCRRWAIQALKNQAKEHGF
jgi:hypothetical protein